MPRSAETRTIFLATDGRFVTLGRDGATDLVDQAIRQVRGLGLAGFIATLTGNPYGTDRVRVVMVSVVDASDDQFFAAAEALIAALPRPVLSTRNADGSVSGGASEPVPVPQPDGTAHLHVDV